MKRLTVALSLSLLASVAAMAQTPAAPPSTPAAPKPAPVPGTKIAIINFRQAVVDSEPGVAASKEFEKEMGVQKTQFEKLDKELADLQDKLKNAKTDAEKTEFTRQVSNKQTDMQRINEDAQKKSEDLQERLLPPIADMVNKALDAYSMENGLAVVLDPTTEPNNVVYANTASDITNEIMRRVNAEFARNPKAAAPASAAPATTPGAAPRAPAAATPRN